MLSLNYENINYVMTQILKLSCVSFRYVSISYVLAVLMKQTLIKESCFHTNRNSYTRTLCILIYFFKAEKTCLGNYQAGQSQGIQLIINYDVIYFLWT